MPQSSAVADLIDQGLAAQQVGDIGRARQHYEAALGVAPEDPEALHLRGLVHEQEGDRDNAILLIEHAIAVDPQEPIFRLNLAAILEKNRQFDDAAEHLKAAVKARPHSSDLLTHLGAIEFHRNDTDNAAAAYRRAFELDSKNFAALAGYGLVMLSKGEVAEAKRALHAVLRASPVEIRGFELAIRIAAADRDGNAISQFANRWKEAKANDQVSLTALAQLLFDLSYGNEACLTFESVIKLDPDSAETLVAYGRYCTAAQKFDQAAEAIDKALSIDPESLTGLFALSRLKYFSGDLQSAEELCNRVTKADPHFSPALTQLCSLRRGDMSDEQITDMSALAANNATPPDQKYELLLSLGRVYDRRGLAKDAFSALKRGNEIGDNNARIFGGGFSMLQCAQETDQIISFFPQHDQERQLSEGPYKPIFIVGMPRSGTTLTESILASHPDAFSIGELSSLPEVYKKVVDWARQTGAATIADAPAELMQSWRDVYFSYYPKDNPAQFLIDKQPINFRHAGLIRALFPAGKIVHIRRNPIETGFSIFRHPFNKDWLFAYHLENIANFYGNYARLVDHWEKTLGEDFPLFQYETLIEDFEKEVRRMLAHCGLDWHEECLSYHDAKRTIATFSSVQARQPVRKTPERAAMRYVEYLKPLTDGLSAASVDLETGALTKAEPS